mgnify:CR=1 FL=1
MSSRASPGLSGAGISEGGPALFRSLTVDQDKSHLARSAGAVAPGMVGPTLDQDVAGLQNRFGLFQDCDDLAFKHDGIVDGVRLVHSRVNVAAFRGVRIVENFSE